MRIEAVCGEGKYRVRGTAVRCGGDVNISLVGGTRPHIGAISAAVYEPERDSATVSTLTVFSHRDDACSAPCAKRVSTALRCTAAVSVGIHIDDAAPEELQLLLANANQCCDALIAKLRTDIDG